MLALASGSRHVLFRPVIGADEEQHRLSDEVGPPRLGREVAPVPAKLRGEVTRVERAAVVLEQERQERSVKRNHP